MLDKKIFVAGDRGMVGSAIKRALTNAGVERVLAASRKELDCTQQNEVRAFLGKTKPDIVIIAAAKVGGIHANNTLPAEFIYENLMIEANLVHQSYLADVEKIIFLGSSCIYPKMAPQPLQESALLTGTLELTNEAYAIAKIAGIKLCESYNRQFDCDYRSLMPTNLYGPGDNFHPEHSHVIPALMRKFHEAKENHAEQVEIWGTGKARREFLHVNDLANAVLFTLGLPKHKYMEVTNPQLSHLNVGTGQDLTIAALAEMIKTCVGYQGKTVFNTDMPDGTPRKLLDTSKINQLGWHPEVKLETGLAETYRWFQDNSGSLRL
ncbi:MAG: GDP-L-fucose synthase [Pseudomonadaceae bacterium]|nr:GDP-L-fucose synthase [Pseudomonadaceae bacterium]